EDATKTAYGLHGDVDYTVVYDENLMLAAGKSSELEPEQKPIPAKLEEEKARGAIKTDFILSAEIMTIALSNIEAGSFVMEAAILATVAIMITVAVYGSVALIVKADDAGLAMARKGRLSATRTLGRGIVAFMPYFMKLLMVVGTAAMLWVGGEIIVHGAAQMGFHGLEEAIYGIAKSVGDGAGFVTWLVKATLHGLFGLALGALLIPLGEKVITPIWRSISGVWAKKVEGV
ncbi:MAG: DUF808 family protein, partial [Pseudomonadota bacterium]